MSSVIQGNDVVADTMALVIRLEKRKLGPNAKAAFAMVLAEVLYLSEKKRIKACLADVANYVGQFSHCKEYPLSLPVFQTAAQITDIPELHDRLIAATARYLNLVILTNDPIIKASSFVTTTW